MLIVLWIIWGFFMKKLLVIAAVAMPSVAMASGEDTLLNASLNFGEEESSEDNRPAPSHVTTDAKPKPWTGPVILLPGSQPMAVNLSGYFIPHDWTPTFPPSNEEEDGNDGRPDLTESTFPLGSIWLDREEDGDDEQPKRPTFQIGSLPPRVSLGKQVNWTKSAISASGNDDENSWEEVNQE
jgi:hypothetical protein